MLTAGLTGRLTLTNMRGKWMKTDKTSGMMAAGDICEFSNCSLFHHIKLPSPNLQTRRNRPGASAEWAAVSKGSIGCMLQERFFAAEAAPFRTHESSKNEQIVPSVFAVPIFSHLTLFIPSRWSGRRRRSSEPFE